MTAPTPARTVAEMKKAAARDAATKPNPSDGNTNPTSKESAMSKTTAQDTAQPRQSGRDRFNAAKLDSINHERARFGLKRKTAEDRYTVADLEIPAWITEALTEKQLVEVADPILAKLNHKQVELPFAKINAERNALHMLHYVRNVLPNLDHTVPSWCTEPHTWRYDIKTGTATRYLGIAATPEREPGTGIAAEASAVQHDDGTLDFTVMVDANPKATPAELRQFAADLMILAEKYEAAKNKSRGRAA